MNKKKRIVFILGSMGRGGAERVVSILSNNYANNDWKVEIILLLDSKCDYTLHSKVRIISLVDKNKSRLRQVPKWVFGIRKYIKQYRPDIILSFAARINIISAIAIIGIKKHFFVSERNDPKKDGRSILVKLATKIIYPKVDRVIFQTKYAQSCFNKKIIENSDIIYNPINVNYNRYNRIIYNSGKIIAVGRLEPQKNHKLLLDSFKKISDVFPRYSLVIYGEGSLRSELEKVISRLNLKGKVSMPGNIKNIHEKLADAEMFVLSSNYEGLSNALMEAMMMGIPCISTNCAGSNEIIEHEKNGLLVPIGDVKLLFESMVRLIKDKDLANKIGENAMVYSAKFKSSNIINEWKKVIEN